MASMADSSAGVKASNELEYAKDEKVLCKHGPCTYPAKILNVHAEQHRFLVHYFGWNPKWDEWVETDRLDKFSDEKAKLAAAENKKVLETLKTKKSGGTPHHPSSVRKSKKNGSEMNSETESGGGGGGRNSATPTLSIPEHVKDSGSGGGSRRSSPSVEIVASTTKTGKSRKIQRDHDTATPGQPEAKRRKVRGSDAQTFATPSSSAASATSVPPTVQSESEYLQLPEVQVTIPDELRRLLVDDWELVTKQMKLARLPAVPTVRQLLDDYAKEKRNAKNIPSTKLMHICESAEGLREYFDMLVSTQLLYKFEKPQYDEIYQRCPDTPASDIYGYTHLLRLFVKIGRMLNLTALDDKSVTVVTQNLSSILKYLNKVRPKDLAAGYEVSSTEYQRKAYS